MTKRRKYSVLLAVVVSCGPIALAGCGGQRASTGGTRDVLGRLTGLLGAEAPGVTYIRFHRLAGSLVEGSWVLNRATERYRLAVRIQDTTPAGRIRDDSTLLPAGAHAGEAFTYEGTVKRGLISTRPAMGGAAPVPFGSQLRTLLSRELLRIAGTRVENGRQIVRLVGDESLLVGGPPRPGTQAFRITLDPPVAAPVELDIDAESGMPLRYATAAAIIESPGGETLKVPADVIEFEAVQQLAVNDAQIENLFDLRKVYQHARHR